jgi:hypothetical protein
MDNRLLDRQASLLEYLSSTTNMFGDHADTPVDPALHGIDPGVLRLQARFICNKRLEKIIAVFTRTFDILGADQRSILREFVEVSPPTNKSTLANAREFHEFLSARWRLKASNPAYLVDVAACELAMVEVLNAVEDHERPAGLKRGIRRHRTIVPLRCAYDIRSSFDSRSSEVPPPKRDTSLVVTLAAGFRDIRLVGVAPVVVDALMLLDDWTDPRMLDNLGDVENLVRHLAAHGFIEVQA